MPRGKSRSNTSRKHKSISPKKQKKFISPKKLNKLTSPKKQPKEKESKLNINIGMIEELPVGRPLETPLNVRKRRIIVQYKDDSDHPDSWSSFMKRTSTQDTKSDHQAPTELQLESYDQPSTSTSHVLAASPPAAHTECKTVAKTLEAAQILQPCQRPLGHNETGNMLNYGSEEEDDDSDDELEPQTIPRSARTLFAAEEDTAQDAEAAGRVDATSASSKMKYGPSSLFDFDWQAITHIDPNLRREKFVRNWGPTIDPISSPYESFVLIWDKPIMEHIVLETNLYAQEYAKRLLERGEMGPTSRISLWKDTTVDELYVYFALTMAMSIVVKAKIEDYWCSDNNIFSTPGFGIFMTLKRFQLLARCLHFNSNNNISPSAVTRSEAKLIKLAPLVKHLNNKFSTLYGLGQNIAVDESLTQWKGWLEIKQFIPNKAAVVGIKTYEVCDSNTGYLWRFEIHVGKTHEESEPAIISGIIPNLVLRLLRGLENRGHTIWMDNYYNSPALARILKSIGFDCVGTLRTNRQFVPEQINNLQRTDMSVGQVCGCTSGDVDLMVWRGQNRVSMLSTYHGIAVSDSKPIVVRDYNLRMGGVDRKDQLVAAYPVERTKTQIWYKKFFKRLLNVSVLNAYILYKHTHSIKHREFRMKLVKEILEHHHQSRATFTVGSVHEVPQFSSAMISHLPMELPLLPGENCARQRRLCVVCKKKRTHFTCEACNVPLCFRFSDTTSCYIKYHT